MNKFVRALPLALILPLSACAAASGESDDRINIVASTQVWADIAAATVSDQDADIHSIIIGDAADPHSFEPSAADMARVETADIIVVGGGGYDEWLYGSLDDDDGRIIHAMELGEHNHGDHGEHEEHVDNEHVWYSTEAVAEVAEDLAEKITELTPEATVTPEAVTTRMDELHERIHHLPEVRVAQTEPIADHILDHSEMIESTPEGYRATTLSEGEPTASDVAAFHELINQTGIDVLIYNPQSASPVATSLRDLAAENNIIIVEISETPEEGTSFLDTFSTAIGDLERATA